MRALQVHQERIAATTTISAAASGASAREATAWGSATDVPISVR